MPLRIYLPTKTDTEILTDALELCLIAHIYSRINKMYRILAVAQSTYNCHQYSYIQPLVPLEKLD